MRIFFPYAGSNLGATAVPQEDPLLQKLTTKEETEETIPLVFAQTLSTSKKH